MNLVAEMPRLLCHCSYYSCVARIFSVDYFANAASITGNYIALKLYCSVRLICMNLVFHISEDGSEIELKHCAFSKTSVKSKIFRALKLDKTRYQSSWLDSSIGRAAV